MAYNVRYEDACRDVACVCGGRLPRPTQGQWLGPLPSTGTAVGHVAQAFQAQPRLPPHNELALISGFQNWASLPFRAVSLNNLLPTWTPKLGTWYDL